MYQLFKLKSVKCKVEYSFDSKYHEHYLSRESAAILADTENCVVLIFNPEQNFIEFVNPLPPQPDRKVTRF